MTWKPFRRRLGSLFQVVLISLFVAVLAGEVYYRFISKVGYFTPEILKSRGLEYEPSLFSAYTLPQTEQMAGGKYYVNRLGYRGHDFSPSKPEGKLRLMFFGGSSVFDPGGLNDEDWPHRIEQLLHESGLSNVEVINAGVIGYSSSDSLGRFVAEGHTFKPDYVFFYSGWNDIKYFKSAKNLLRRFELYARSPIYNYNGRLDRFLCEHSQVYAHLRNAYYQQMESRAAAARVAPDGYAGEVNYEHLKQYRLNLEMFVGAARDIGATPVLLTEPTLAARNNNELDRSRIRYQSVQLNHEQLCEAVERIENVVREVAAAKQVAFIDASNRLSGRTDLFWDHGHLTMKGSETFARLIAQEFPAIQSSRDAAAKQQGAK
jgi:lysophospholipase L1-like esterase